MKKQELRQLIKEEILKISESNKKQTIQEMDNLAKDILESNKRIKQLMKDKGYEI
jgi:hypothetical protein